MTDPNSDQTHVTRISQFATPARDTNRRSGETSEIAGVGDDAPATSPDHQPQLSGQFGPYVIDGLVGEGAMGRVYRALDTRLDRTVALKIPSLGSATNDRQLKRFHREARSAANLHHPNICAVFDVGQIDGTNYIAMQFLDGRTLAEIIRENKPLDPLWAARVAQKLAMALQAAHTAGIVHRDLKPANIVVVKDDEPVIMDFGLARTYDDVDTTHVTQEGMVIGSPAYMSPEQMAGKPLGPPTDIFSLGVVLHEMLTGRTPFVGSVISIATQILNDPPPVIEEVRPEVPPELGAICRTAMAKNPEDRFRSMQDLALILDAFLRNDTVDATIAKALLPNQLHDTKLFGSTSEASMPQRSTALGATAVVGAAAILIAALVWRPWAADSVTTAGELDIDPVYIEKSDGVEKSDNMRVSKTADDPTSIAEDNVSQNGPNADNVLDEMLEALEGPPSQNNRIGPGMLSPEMDRRLRNTTGRESFAEWDTNGDGEIDGSELPNHILKRGDSDGNGLLTRDEYDSAVEQQGREFFGPPNLRTPPPPPRPGPLRRFQ